MALLHGSLNSKKDFSSEKYIKTRKDSEDEAASDSEEELREAAPKASRRLTEESPLGGRLAPCATLLPPSRNYPRSKAVHMDPADVLRASHRNPSFSAARIKNEDLDDKSPRLLREATAHLFGTIRAAPKPAELGDKPAQGIETIKRPTLREMQADLEHARGYKYSMFPRAQGKNVHDDDFPHRLGEAGARVYNEDFRLPNRLFTSRATIQDKFPSRPNYSFGIGWTGYNRDRRGPPPRHHATFALLLLDLLSIKSSRSRNWTRLSPQSDPLAMGTIATIVTILSNTIRHRKLMVPSTLKLRSRASTSPASLPPCASSYRRQTFCTSLYNMIDLRQMGTFSRKARTIMLLCYYMSFSLALSLMVY
jgi:hypothetical protein